nr:hypothetical protein [Haladaptatus sp. DYF46]
MPSDIVSAVHPAMIPPHIPHGATAPLPPTLPANALLTAVIAALHISIF